LLGLVAKYQRNYAVNKLIISRKNGRLHFDGDPKKGEEVSLVRELYGSDSADQEAEFEKLIETMPTEYLRFFPEMRWDSPFVVGITDAGQRYLRH
jgi:hypothetical protein